ncbi:DNA polymerase-4 [Arthrobacter sp. SLBN-112]|nr:DNA polymerase-4 [Arthrobacter sp. SLBN-112]
MGPAGMNQPSAARPPGRRPTCIMHVDMDAFFVSVELRTRPELRGKPVIVGFPGERSVVLSGSYEARAFGVKSAMPMAVAMRMCPQAVVIEPRHKLYYEVSGQLMAIFESITGLVEPLSVDEAFLDVTGALRRLGPPRGIGELIRRRVAAELGITASVGIAETKFVAKIASTRCKPDGLLLIGPDETVPYLHSLPVGALWGVGAKTGEVLAKMGIRSVADVAATPVSSLKKVLGATGEHVHQLAWGIDPRPVTPVRLEKSIGAEETFAVDTTDDALLRRELLRLSHRTATRLRSSGMVARTVALKLRFADFSTITRSRTVQTPVDSAQLVYAVALQLLESVGTRAMAVRLVGVRAEQLEEAARTSLQLSIDRREENWRAAEQALDEVARKFGNKSVLPARLMEQENRPVDGSQRPA